MRRHLDLTDSDYAPDPDDMPRRRCRNCQRGRCADCCWDRCGCECNQPKEN